MILIIKGGNCSMMINKRLINLCKESKKYIALTILVNWISVLCYCYNNINRSVY